MSAPMPRPVLFEVAANPDPESSLPFLIRLPLPDGELVLKGPRQLAADRQGLLPPRRGMARAAGGPRAARGSLLPEARCRD
jgi:hypothetical protein